MAIRYSLVENKLTPDPNDMRAQVEHGASIGVEEIAAAIARPGSTVTKAEMLAFWEEFCQEIIKQLLLGNRIVLDLFVASVSMEGVFTNPQDSFDPTRHKGRINMTPNSLLRKAEADLHFEQVRATASGPILDQVYDFKTKATTGTLTAGGAARATGSQLKVDMDDPQQGVFLVAANGTATRVLDLHDNLPGELLFTVPEGLAAGAYRLEVRNSYKGGQSLRTAQLAIPVILA